MQNDLTIILTLKGREAFTYRWLDYVSENAFKFNILIADGDKNSNVKKNLSKPAYNKLKINYLNFNDQSWSDYYRKVYSVAKLVKTKYVMVSDNDDFIVRSGINSIISFLDSHEDHISVGSNILFFNINNKKNELLKGGNPTLTQIYNSPRLEEPLENFNKQLNSTFQNFQPNFYNIYRRDAFEQLAKELSILSFSDPSVAEIYQQLRIPTIGKQKKIVSSIHYLRQEGTSNNKHNFVESLIEKDLPSDIRKMSREISKHYASFYKQNNEVVYEQVNAYYVKYLTDFLSNTHLRHRFPRFYMIKKALLKSSVLIPFQFLRSNILHNKLLFKFKRLTYKNNFIETKKELENIFSFLKNA